jgi:hypothetical protein
MRKIISTGDAAKDAELVSKALGQSNTYSRAEDEKKAKDANSGKFSGNILATRPHQAGETLLVVHDSKTKEEEEEKPNTAESSVPAKLNI